MKRNERELCGYGFLVGIVALAWGLAIFARAVGLMSQFTVIDGTFLLTVGAILCMLSVKYYQILSQKKWYENIRQVKVG